MVSSQAHIEERVSLKDCQVGANFTVTKEGGRGQHIHTHTLTDTHTHTQHTRTRTHTHTHTHTHTQTHTTVCHSDCVYDSCLCVSLCV